MSSFTSDIQRIKDFGAFFDLQPRIAKEVTAQNVTTVIGQVMDIVATSAEELPHIVAVLEAVVKTAGGSSVRLLEPFLQRGCLVSVRMAALGAIVACRPIRCPDRLVTLAEDATDDRAIRLAALRALTEEFVGAGNLHGLVALLSQPDFALQVLDVIKAHPESFTYTATVSRLEMLAATSTGKLQSRAIEALGVIGEIDVIERVAMMRLNGPEAHKAVGDMVQQIMSRPRNILHLRPENFENLIGQLLVSLGYRNVDVIGRTGDGGVDVVAEKMGQGLNEGKVERVVVQCKRWADKRVDAETLRNFLGTVSQKGAKEGVLITTSGFTGDAGDVAKVNAHLELIDGLGLQERLDKAFGAGVYRIKSRD